MRNKYKILIMSFILPLFFIMFYGLFEKDKLVSTVEKRELAKFPEFTIASYTDASFFRDFELYFNDHFPWRDNFIAINKYINKLYYSDLLINDEDVIMVSASMGETVSATKESSSDTVNTDNAVDTTQPSSDANTSGETLNSEKDSTPSDTQKGMLIYKSKIMEVFRNSSINTTNYANILNKLYNECGQPDTYVILPPPAFTLYAPTKSKDATTDFYSAYDDFNALLNGPKLIDLNDTFEEHKNDYLYFNTDHHWTATAAYYACNEFLKISSNSNLPEINTYKSGTKNGFLGSLYNSLLTNSISTQLKEFSDDVTYYYPFNEATVSKFITADMTNGEAKDVLYPDYSRDGNLYNIFFNGDIPLGHIKSEVKNGKSIMVVRDSFGHAFVPFLIDAYEDIYFVEPRYFNKETKDFILSDFFKENNIDSLLFLNYTNTALSEYWAPASIFLEKLSAE